MVREGEKTRGASLQALGLGIHLSSFILIFHNHSYVNSLHVLH